MTFLSEMDPATGFVNRGLVREKGAELHEAYASADPFPHIVIDDFLPEPVLRMCLDEFGRSQQSDEHKMYDREQERFKREFKPDDLSPAPRGLFYSFNSRPFLRVIENITGIAGLIPDPFFLGGGFHEVQNGGHLSIHADFNHHKLMDLERRVNVLIYLNEGWQAEYGGQLELWDTEMKGCVQSIVPVLNRCVIFNTTSSSNHGNPNPVAHPAGISRKSIALYYYTSTWDADKRSHTTQFRPRPGSVDRRDWGVRRREIYADVVPPIMRRGLAAARRALSGKGGEQPAAPQDI